MGADVDVAILGAGFGGLCLGIRLKQAGRDRFVILEKADRIGGTWRDNSYPGAACDVPSHLYSLSFAPKADWSRVYAPQPEILGYMEDLVADHALGPHIRLDAEVVEARWSDRDALWQVRTADGSTITARVFVAAWGQLHRPKVPDLPGRDSFSGPAFHSARWRHDVDLSGLRVASVGNAASAAQLIPEIAPVADRVTVFQRSANWVVPRLDRAYRDDEIRTFRDDPGLLAELRDAEFEDREGRWLRLQLGTEKSAETEQIARDHLRAQVPDPALRDLLTPDYPVGCKRILITDDYYPALARDDVRIVTAPIERVLPDGILTADGVRHELDAIVWATGFETHSFQGPVEVFGRDGRSLREVWDPVPEAYLGMTVAGFPNFAMLYGPNTNLGHNSILLMIEAEVDYLLQALDRLDGGRAFDLRPEVQARFNERLVREFAGSAWIGGCRSWYVDETGRVINNWAGTVRAYQEVTARLDPRDYDWTG